MVSDIIKHEIIIITYNQEKTILGALNSAINQTMPPYKISIFDDCSTDQTVSLLKEQIKKSSIKIDLHVNHCNLGIFANWNQAIHYATGEMVHILAGDDEYELDLLENYTKYVFRNNIDLNKPVWLIPNIIEFYENGVSIMRNQYRYHDYSLFKVILLGKIRSFELGLSLSSAKLSTIRTDIGYQADNLKSLLLCKLSEVRIVDFYGYKYRIYTGVTTRTNRKKQLQSRKKCLDILLHQYADLLTSNEQQFVKCEVLYVDYLLYPKAYSYFKQALFLIRTLPCEWRYYGLNGLKRFIPLILKDFIKRIIKEK